MCHGPGADAHNALVDWCSNRLKRVLAERQRVCEISLGNNAKSFRVQDLDFRWGSCDNGNVSYFHWKVALLPLRIIDYVITHELLHLKIPATTQFFGKN